MTEWLGVDFDGTLAKYDGWKGHTVLGLPIPSMVEKVNQVRSMGVEVRIFTARCYPLLQVIREETDLASIYDEAKIHGAKQEIVYAVEAVHAIQNWCKAVFGCVLPITCVKDYGMAELWDDRAIHVIPNTGRLSGPSRRYDLD